ncbi:hypothetical protein [Pinirhizobacter soli]|uniref:hypothetical protein n=1 Tax=Pinirhizobacter soli TaxID=2786953 RepID=UPI00202A85AC|nr:hypothetical protein [Pinirhizobacter soli]
MEKKQRIGTCIALAACMTLGLVGGAQAATSHSISYKYFDDAGNLVGQKVTLCSNITRHAATVDTQYYIMEQTSCSPTNPPPPLDEEVTPDVGLPGTIVSSYNLPSFLSISAACVMAECQPTGTAEVVEIQDKGWTWLPGLD